MPPAVTRKPAGGMGEGSFEQFFGFFALIFKMKSRFFKYGKYVGSSLFLLLFFWCLIVPEAVLASVGEQARGVQAQCAFKLHEGQGAGVAVGAQPLGALESPYPCAQGRIQPLPGGRMDRAA